MLKIYIDASTKGNPGPSGIGMIFIGENIYKQIALPAGLSSNHEAEFFALQSALEFALAQGWQDQTLFIFSDSQVVCETIDKNYTHNPKFKHFLEKIALLLAKFPLVIIRWIPEKENKGADQLARQGLQKELKNNKKT